MPNISLRSLEVLIMVVEAGSFSLAAERLGISQPSVSEHIRGLEAYSGTLLFERKRGRPATLTRAGERMLGHARIMLGDAARLAEEVNQYKVDSSRRIRFATQRLVANAVLPSALALFAREYPEYELALFSGTMDDVLEQVEAGRADLGCFLALSPPSGILCECIGTERFIFVAAPVHPLAKRRTISARELATHKFVRAAHRSSFAQEMEAMLAAIGIDDTPVASRATETAAVIEMASLGVGVLCTLEKSVRQQLASGTLVELKLENLRSNHDMKMSMYIVSSTKSSARSGVEVLSQHLSSKL